MDDLQSRLVAFCTARLDEEEQRAYLLSGTEWTANCMGDFDYEIRVQHDPLLHGTIAPAGGIADVEREDVAEWIAGHSPRQAQRDVVAKRAILQHCIEAIDSQGAYREDGSEYVADQMLAALASAWSNHPDYQQATKDS